MASLWNAAKAKTKRKQKIKRKKPSPTCKHIISNSAQNSNKNSIKNSNTNPVFVKRSLPSTLWKRTLRAGMTVEAAVVLPMCLFFLLNLGCAIELIRLHNHLEVALLDTGSKIAVYEREQSEKVATSVLTAFYVKNRIVESAGREYLEQSPLADGTQSLSLINSKMLQNDCINIVLTYAVSPYTFLAGFHEFRMSNRIELHLWNGYAIPDNPSETGVVYVTPFGEVYHTSRDCYHLSVTVKAVPAADIENERNSDRKKYHNCKKCAYGKEPEEVYITEDGDCFHYDKNCSGLKRTVYSITAEEAEEKGYRICSDCKMREGKNP